MNSSLVISLIGLLLSIAASVMSLVIPVQQTALLRQSNHMPISVVLAQEFRSDTFMDANDYEVHKLRHEHSPEAGVSGLPFDARRTVDRITSYFTMLTVVC